MTEEQRKRFVLGEVPDLEPLLGEVEENREPPHRCDGARCSNQAHRRKMRIFVNDKRKPPKWTLHNEAGTWVSHYCTPSEECQKASGYSFGKDCDFDLTQLEIIPWPGGVNVLIGSPRCGIGSTFIAWSQAEEVAI